jgi:uncharacterized membrane protein (UPF0127 family)
VVLIFLLFEISILSACTYHYQTLQANKTSASFRKDGTLDFIHSDNSVIASIDIEIADTPETLKKGLMGRSALDDGSGMLFVFQRLEPQRFWMKNTPIPLDIIFIGENGCIVNMVESATPMSNQRYRSEGPIKYAVEVRAGFAKHFQLDTDTCIRWQHQ